MVEIKYSFQTLKNFGQLVTIVLICIGLFSAAPVLAFDNSGEQIYQRLSTMANTVGSESKLAGLNNSIRSLSWNLAKPVEFVGNLRVIRPRTADKGSVIYLLRKLTGKVYLLSIPGEPAEYRYGRTLCRT